MRYIKLLSRLIDLGLQMRYDGQVFEWVKRDKPLLSILSMEWQAMFDWQSRSWRRAGVATETGASWRMTLTGDWAPFAPQDRLMQDDPASVYGDLLPILQASDLNVANVEAVMGDAGQPILKDGPALRSPAGTVNGLTAVPFHVATLANNHIMDFGLEGLRETVRVLEDAGVKTVGAAEAQADITRPAICTVKGVKVAIINVAEGESGRSIHGEPGVQGLDVFEVARQTRELKAAGLAEVVVVVFHGGRECIAVPPPYVVKELRQIASCGVDAVVAHHPHVPQAIEMIDDVPIFYSLGNFLFWRNSPGLYNRVGYLAHLDFSGKRLVGCAVTPYVCYPEGVCTMNQAQLDWLRGEMEQVTKPLASLESVRDAWEAFVGKMGRPMALARMKRIYEGWSTGDQTQAFAAILRNAFLTPAHREFFSSELAQEAFDAPPPVQAWVDCHTRWLEQPIAGHPLFPESRPG